MSLDRLGLFPRMVAAALAGLIVTVAIYVALNCPREQAVETYQKGLMRNGTSFAGLFSVALAQINPAATTPLSTQSEHVRAQIAGLLKTAVPKDGRLRFFDTNGTLIFDSGLSPEMLERAKQWFVPGQLLKSLANWWSGVEPVPMQHLLQMSIVDLPEAQAALAGRIDERAYEDATGIPAISIGIPVHSNGIPAGALVISICLTDVTTAGRLGMLAVACAGLFGLAVTCTILFLLHRQVKRNARQMAQALDRISQRESVVGPFVPLSDTLQPALAGSINQLVQVLRERADESDLFAREMSHELKNPLTSLRSAVETAERISDPEQHRRLMSVIVQDVARLDRLISAITDLSQVEAELAATPDEQVDLEAMLAAFVEIENAASHGELDPIFILIDGGSFAVRGVESRVAQVFRNILQNARSFSPPGSSIRLALTRSGDRVTVTCDDDGPGIPQGKEDVIFQRFYSDRPVDQPFAGHSGLGLSLCRQIVTAHAGEIRAENRLDPFNRVIGARLTVTLPAAG